LKRIQNEGCIEQLTSDQRGGDFKSNISDENKKKKFYQIPGLHLLLKTNISTRPGKCDYYAYGATDLQ
jgi:hypothetical protein